MCRIPCKTARARSCTPCRAVGRCDSCGNLLGRRANADQASGVKSKRRPAGRNTNTGEAASPVSGTVGIWRCPWIPELRTHPAEWRRRTQTRHTPPAHRASKQGPRTCSLLVAPWLSLATTRVEPKQQIFCSAEIQPNALRSCLRCIANILIVRDKIASNVMFAAASCWRSKSILQARD